MSIKESNTSCGSHHTTGPHLEWLQGREVLGCPHCGLVQFCTRNLLCRRCHKPLEQDERNYTMSQASIVPEKLDPGRVRDEFVKGLGPRIRALRKQRSITQLEFAQKMGVPRTYISKVEMSRAIPTLSTLLRIADALGMNVDELLSEERRRRNQEIAAIFVDEFLGEIAKYAGALTPLQKVLIIRAVRRAAQHEKE